ESRVGFPHYGEMITRLEALPQVTAAVPTIETFALINIDNEIRNGVRTVGIPMDRIGEVNQFWDSLYLKKPGHADQVVVDWREIIDYELELVFKRIDEAVERGVYTAEKGRDEKQKVQAVADGEIAQVDRAMKRQAEN